MTADALAAVLARPDDRTARLALAGELDRAGDPQGELIRVQLELADLPQHTSPALRGRVAELLGRSDELLARYGERWQAPVAPLCDRATFHRGLVGEVTLAVDRFLDVVPELLTRAPVQHANLKAPATRIAEVVASPWLARLKSLALEELGLGDAFAVALAGSPHAANLRWLSLDFNQIGQAGVEALAASPHLRELRFLSMLQNPVDPTPRPSGQEAGALYGSQVSPLAGELEARFGPRPWLQLGDIEYADEWPPDRDRL